jgi:hypothetical protein
MGYAVFRISLVGLPGKMIWIYAAEVAIPARMSGLMLRCGRWPVSLFADKTVSKATTKIAVSIFVAAILPCQASITVIRQDDLSEISLNFAFRCSQHHTCERIAMVGNALVMHRTPAACHVRVAAILYGTQ